jgi:sigma-B regulation protein RsbU (phosphoserine phosphatase)
MGKLMIPSGMVLLYEPKDDSYIVSKAKGLSSLPEGQKVTFAHPAELRKHAIIIPEDDLTASAPLFGAGKQSILFNLITRDNHIGFLCLAEKGDKSELDQHEINFMESLARMSSVAIANLRMFAELRKTNRILDRKIHELNTLFELSKNFNRMVNRQELTNIFKNAMLGQMSIRKFFFLLEQNNHRLLAAANNMDGSLHDEEIDALFDLKEEVVMVNEELRRTLPFVKTNDIKALISLYFQDEKLAVVGIGTRAKNEPYTESDFISCVLSEIWLFFPFKRLICWRSA